MLVVQPNYTQDSLESTEGGVDFNKNYLYVS